MNETDRVKIWNTFFKLAHEQAMNLNKMIDPNWKVKIHDFSGGTLDNEQTLSLSVIAWCLLAIEARETHLLEELKDAKKLTPDETKAIQFLGIKEKWALLPKLAGKDSIVYFDKPPHQVISQLDSIRNDLFHIRYEKLVRKLPSGSGAVGLFNKFVRAMDDMNVMLERQHEHNESVRKIALDE